MHRILTLTVAAHVALTSLAIAQPKKKNPVPAAERIKLLKVFNSEFVSITPGKGKFPKSFKMGSDKGKPAEKPVREVTMSGPFAMAKYEVPQNLYLAVMGENPSRWKGPRNSAEMMSWNDAVAFCKVATKMMRDAKIIKAGEVIRLPSEAEWEYCCRAGTTTEYSFGDKARKPGDGPLKASLLDPYGWHTGNAAGNDPPVGKLKPNAWGLYDMHGYLLEFVSDAWHTSYKGAPKDASPWTPKGKRVLYRVLRSGSWRDRYDDLRSASRMPILNHSKSDAVGFRCVKAAK